MPGRFSLYKDLTVQENLRFFATLFRTRPEDAYDLIRDIYAPLEPFRHRPAGKLSGGMKQKLALCCALVHRPAVLFLDEPTTGVDVMSRKEFWDTLGRLQSSGLTTVVSTPYMDEADRCDRIALVQSGRVLAVDTPEGMVRRYPGELFAVWAEDMSGLLAALRRHPLVERCFSFGETHHVNFYRTDEPALAAVQADLQREHAGLGLEAIRPGVEDCFIRLML
jgi:ABC-type multidrug transport system ATPase subunit